MTTFRRADGYSRPIPLQLFSSLPTVAQIGQPYLFLPAAQGGTPPYTWTRSGPWPSWAAFDAATGAITGTPDALTTYAGLSVTVTDSGAGPAQQSATAGPVDLVIQSGPVIEIPDRPATLADAWAPARVVICIDCDDGDDANDGSFANPADLSTYRPIRSLDRLMELWTPTIQNTDTVVRVLWKASATGYYRRTRDWETTYGGVSEAAAFALTRAKPTEMLVWGNPAHEARIVGDRPVTGWTSIPAVDGSAYAAANGEQATLPWEAPTGAAVFVGDDMCTPAFWASNKANIDTASRWLFATRYAGVGVAGTSEVYEYISSSDIQTSGGTHDLTRRVSRQGPSSQSPGELVINAPGSGARYADEAPTGAVIATVLTPNAGRFLEIPAGGFSAADNRFTLPVPTTLSISTQGWPWAVLGWCRDIRQAGQYGYKPPQSGQRVVHMVPPTGATGDRSVAFFRRVARFRGIGWRVSAGFAFGRAHGEQVIWRMQDSAIGPLRCFQQLQLGQPGGGQTCEILGYESTSVLGVGNVFGGLTEEWCTTGGGLRVENNVSFGMDAGARTIRMNDASTWRMGGTVDGITFENYVTNTQIGIHGSGDTTYERSRNITRRGFAAVGGRRSLQSTTSAEDITIASIERLSAAESRVTTQSAHGLQTGQWVKFYNVTPVQYVGLRQVTVLNATQFTVQNVAGDPVTDMVPPAGKTPRFAVRPFGWQGKRMTIENGLAWGARAIDPTIGAGRIPGVTTLFDVRYDVENSLFRRLIVWQASNPFLLRAQTSTAPWSMEGMRIVNCVVENLAIASDVAETPFGGAAPVIANNFFRSQSGPTTGYTYTDNRIASGAGWNGALTTGATGQWEVYSRVVNAAGVWDGTSYEASIIGPVGYLDGQDWTIPAYTASPSFATPRPVTPSTREYPINAPQGWPFFYCLGGEPGSTYGLPPAVDDNDFAVIDGGVVMVGAGNRASAPSYTFTVRKTNAAFPAPGHIDTQIVCTRLR